ncbi:MAG TPA: TetR/AcrR family transcriptional regulator [Anaerolineales bacterium]|nr:TetR/AcrR family transcriptional regulator [Anaerolineales bacterium]HLO28326.1 TetR/AcrR family transcriptional regulator [Anaerolineales bacterium]
MTHNEPDREDLRVKRTQKLILEAMIELTSQKGFSTVTVNDIAKYAGINRATFYRHYQDKFDLLDRYAQAFYELSDAPPEARPQTSGESIDKQIAPGMARMFEHIRANARFYRVMLGKNGDPAFSEKIRQYIRKRIRDSLPEELRSDQTSLDLYLSYISSGSLGALTWWLEHEMPYSPEEMAAISYRLNAANLNAMSHAPRLSKES